MIFYYILALVIILYLLFKLYIKIRYPFWSSQPVFHNYNLINWISPSGIVNDSPKINNYSNFIDITSKNFFDYSEEEIINIVDLINNNFKTNYGKHMESNYLLNTNSFVAFLQDI